MRYSVVYECRKCLSTKTLIHDSIRVGHNKPEFPFTLPCGWRGCDGDMRWKSDIAGDVVIHRDPYISDNVAILMTLSVRPEDWKERSRKIIFTEPKEEG